MQHAHLPERGRCRGCGQRLEENQPRWLVHLTVRHAIDTELDPAAWEPPAHWLASLGELDDAAAARLEEEVVLERSCLVCRECRSRLLADWG